MSDRTTGSASIPPPLVPGTLMGDYRLMRTLGRGGMGEVFLARDVRLGRRVALKVIESGRIGSPDAAERFLFEAQTAARFSHPNIVTIYAVGEHQGQPWVAMEYLEGESLRERIAQERPGARESLRILRDVATALAEAHRQGVLHRDLKPENVVMARDGRLRVLDFGLAKLMEAPPVASDVLGEQDLHTLPAQQVHKTRGVCGTPPYMAPEQLRDGETGPAGDVWAFGVIAYELLCGRRPYEAYESSLLSLATRVSSDEAVPPCPGFAEVPMGVARVLQACLAKVASDRPSAAALVERIGEALDLAPAATADERNPFPGLLPFAEHQSSLFFGRAAEIATFLERLREQPVLPVVGPSGAGKSSFVRAGVVPRLREQGPWIVLDMRPGATPFLHLARRLLAGETTEVTRSATLRTTDLWSSQEPDMADATVSTDPEGEPGRLARQLRASPERVGLLLRAVAEAERGRVLLFVDQLEEIQTLGADHETQARFLQALAAAADDLQDPVRVVVTVRDDFLGRLATGPRARDALSRVFMLRPPAREALMETLHRPVAAHGYRWEDPDLVSRMIAAVEHETNRLPLLQFAARRMWEHRDRTERMLTASAYHAMGGVEGALADQADGVLAGLASAETEEARALLLRLVTTEGTRRVVEEATLLDGLGTGARQVLARLVEGRLVSARRSPGETGDEVLLELAHESLIGTWARLARWIESSREDLAFLSELEQAARLWNRRGRRGQEAWTGDALQEALRRVERCSTPASEVALAFLDTGASGARRRQRRRRLVLGTAIGALGLVAIGATIGALTLARKEREARERRVEAERARSAEQVQRAEAQREGARLALGRGEVLQARAKVRGALETQDSLAARALWWRLRREALWWGRSFGAALHQVAFSPDGDTVAVASADGTVHLVDIQTSRSVALRGHSGQVMGLAFSRDGRKLVSGGRGGAVWLWQGRGLRRTGRVLATDPTEVASVAFHPDGGLVATGGRDGRIRLHYLRSDTPPRTLPAHLSWVRALAFTPDGQMLASGGGDQRVRLWDVASGRRLRELGRHAGPVTAVVFHPRGKLLASGAARDRTVRLWDPRSGESLGELGGHPGGVFAVAISRDGRTAATAGDSFVAFLWDLRNRRRLREWREHKGRVRAVALDPRGRFVATAGTDQTLRIWRADRARAVRAPVGHRQPVMGVAISPDSRFVASGSFDGTVRLWDVATGEQRRVLVGHPSRITPVDFSPDGRLLASASARGDIRVWDLETGVARAVLMGHGSSVISLRFEPGGRRLASGDHSGVVNLWDLSSRRPHRTIQASRREVGGLAFHPNGRWLVSGGEDRTVRVWDLRTGKGRSVARLPTNSFGLALSPDGTWTLTGGRRGGAWRVDLATGATSVASPFARAVFHPDIHPDGRQVGAPRSDGRVALTDIATGRTRLLEGHRGEVNFLRFSADGRLAVTSSDDRTVRLWDVRTGRPRWHAPVLLATPPRLFSHRGWSRPGGATGVVAPPSAKRWREAVEQRARQGAQRKGLLCLVTWDDALELWDMKGDRRVARTPLRGARDVVALSQGCAVLTGGGVVRLDAGGAVLRLPLPGASAIASLGEHLLVVAGTELSLRSGGGRAERRWTVPPGVTAVALQGRQLLLGFRNGDLERWDIAGQRPARVASLERVSASPVLRLLRGPRGVVFAGQEDGTLAWWELGTGGHLGTVTLHGAVLHLGLNGTSLYGATELGDAVHLDFEVFRLTWCDLLRRIWEEVAVHWVRGSAVVGVPPGDQPCAPR